MGKSTPRARALPILSPYAAMNRRAGMATGHVLPRALANLGSALIGAALALGALWCLALASHSALRTERLDRLVQMAKAAGDLDYSRNQNEDYFTECSMVGMIRLREQEAMRDAFITRWLRPGAGEHPCDTLRRAFNAENAPPYVNYAFASRFVGAITLSRFDIAGARKLYLALSYLSVVALLIGAVAGSFRLALTLAPGIVFLLWMFSFHRFGGNLAHAPGFIAGFLGLALFVAAPAWFQDRRRRVGYFAFLGTIVGAFDLIHGTIVTTLSLGLVLNRLFYGKGDTNWRRALADVAVLSTSFVLGYAVLTGARLLILDALYGIGWTSYAVSLSNRMASGLESMSGIGAREIAGALWQARHQLAPGGYMPATWAVCIAIAAALLVVGLALRQRHHRLPALSIDLAVCGIAALGVGAWYMLFAAHTYIHALFAVRLATIPMVIALVAAALAIRAVRPAAKRLALDGATSLAAAVVLMTPFWGAGSAELRGATLEGPTDLVSCSRLGLAPDGKPDGLVSVVYSQSQGPLAFLWGAADSSPAEVVLERFNPHGIWATGPTSFILGVSADRSGPLLNGGDGRVRLPGNASKLWLHFCQDGGDRPDSRYRVTLNGQATDLSCDPKACGRVDAREGHPGL
ncbi:MAG TPA: hypothetical protein VF601_16225 [Beijerinckiaceae bacterium]